MMGHPEGGKLPTEETCAVEVHPTSITHAMGFWQGVEGYTTKDIFRRTPVRFSVDEVVTILNVNSRFAFFAPFKTKTHYVVRYRQRLENQILIPELPIELRGLSSKEISASRFLADIFISEFPLALLFSPLNHYVIGLVILTLVPGSLTKELSNVLRDSALGLSTGQQRMLFTSGFLLLPTPMAILGYAVVRRWAKKARDIKNAQLMLLLLIAILGLLCMKTVWRYRQYH